MTQNRFQFAWLILTTILYYKLLAFLSFFFHFYSFSAETDTFSLLFKFNSLLLRYVLFHVKHYLRYVIFYALKYL